MDHQPKISVIIPVYNTEEYVKDAVESIQHQTLYNIEIIIINDGSTDNSIHVVEKLAATDDRIQIHTKENGGQSFARNWGLTFATGIYIYFMDSDDVLAPETLEECYRICQRGMLDFITFDADIYNNEVEVNPGGLKYDRSTTLRERVYSGQEALDVQLRTCSYTPSPCLYMVRRKMLFENNLLFKHGIIHEDQLFTCLLYLHAKRVSYVNKKYYHRRIREHSTMTNTFSWHNVESYLIVANELLLLKSGFKKNEQKTIDLLLSSMLDAVMNLSYKLPVRKRFYLFRICIIHYPRYVRPMTLIRLAIKFLFR